MNLYALQLEILVTVLGLSVLLLDAFSPIVSKKRMGYLLSAAVASVFFYSFRLVDLDQTALFHGLYRLDAFSLFFKRLFLAALAVVLVLSAEFSDRIESGVAEFYALTLFCGVGMLLLASSNDFLMLFVALELVTISFYILTSFLRRQIPSLEAGTKYLILGALSSGFTLYGISFVFGTAGSTRFDEIASQLLSAGGLGAPYAFGMLLILTGLCFKIAAAPFQVWAPDVYQGAPTPVTAFLAVGSKAAGFAILLRIYLMGLFPVDGAWALLFAGLSAVTLFYGNLGALPQKNLKRLLGYSSIGHAGYMLMGIAAGSPLGAGAVLFYLVQYAFTNFCIFLALVSVSAVTGTDDIRGFSGLHRRSPLLSVALLFGLMSLAGIPPFSGFFGKFQLFLAVIERAAEDGRFYILAFVAAAAVVVSLYFYLGVARAVYLEDSGDATPIPVSFPMKAALCLCMAVVLGLGLYQAPLVDASRRAVEMFGLR